MNNFVINYGLILLGLAITLASQAFINSSYSKYRKIKAKRGMTGYDVARDILDKNDLHSIDVIKTSGYLSDHYDPRRKVIRLSSDVYDKDSIAAVSVAAHECGHAIQDKEGYKFLKIRNSIIPIVNLSSYMGYIALLIGIIFSSRNFIWLGIISELIIVLFQIITLPVEIDASKRALKALDYSHTLSSDELKQSKTMLLAAALTYVASVLTAILEILRLVLIFGGDGDD